MKRFALGLAMLSPCGAIEDDVSFAADASSKVDGTSGYDGVYSVTSPNGEPIQVAVGGGDAGCVTITQQCPPPVEYGSEPIQEACSDATYGWFASHTFEGMNSVDAEARVSAVCVRPIDQLDHTLKWLQFETMPETTVSGNKVTVTCGGPSGSRCGHVLFFVRN
jgi:hypothetical protein